MKPIDKCVTHKLLLLSEPFLIQCYYDKCENHRTRKRDRCVVIHLRFYQNEIFLRLTKQAIDVFNIHIHIFIFVYVIVCQTLLFTDYLINIIINIIVIIHENVFILKYNFHFLALSLSISRKLNENFIIYFYYSKRRK